MTTDKLQHWQGQLADSRQQLLTFLQALTPEQWERVVFSEGEGWTVTAIVAHLIDGERGMSIQVHKIRKGEEATPEGFDLHRWNAGVTRRISERDPARLLAALESTRAKTLEVMASLKDEDWERTGRHPSRGMISVEQYYETISSHERQHLADMQRALDLQSP